ncbi:hypothetical protein JTE90_000519 [Oedothorax gibbosus]|uniref:Uncharacterized protein n=1 Tax=Oedothorax gibbosus TaxID=931172 RepID=A0AAV6VWJ4_9ARAC|nr:hypothetical protein JTE90_000519 [Oedothorax gibbosus]
MRKKVQTSGLCIKQATNKRLPHLEVIVSAERQEFESNGTLAAQVYLFNMFLTSKTKYLTRLLSTTFTNRKKRTNSRRSIANFALILRPQAILCSEVAC